MLRIWSFALLFLVGAASGWSSGSPAPASPPPAKKPMLFPAGKYVLGGLKAAARAEDLIDLSRPFHLKPGQFIISGGPNPLDKLFVDDDLEILQEGKNLFIDDDNVCTTDTRNGGARYKGDPIVLVLDTQKKLQLRAIDCCTRMLFSDLYIFTAGTAPERN